MSDHHPDVIAGHVALGTAVARLDMLESRTFAARGGGLYFSPDVPPAYVQSAASIVALELAHCGRQRV